jgi:hypothetical protein
LTAAAVVALTACSGGVTVRGHKDVSANFLPIELYVVATGDNELRTIIIGNPFNLPKAEFETAVLASMAGRNFGPRLNLSTNPKQEDARKRRVVIASILPAALPATCCARSPPTSRLSNGREKRCRLPVFIAPEITL